MNSGKEKKSFITELVLIGSLVFGILIWILNVDKAEMYTVSFHSVGGTHIASEKVSANKKVSMPSAPKKDGYSFKGWYDGDTLFDFQTAIQSDLNLEAKWEKIMNGARTKIIKISIPTISISLGREKNLLEGITQNFADSQVITFSSENDSMVKIDKYGNIEGIQEGTTFITILLENQNYKFICKVNVLDENAIMQVIKGVSISQNATIPVAIINK